MGAKELEHAAIAQLDRVTDYESVGRGFESLSPYQKQETPSGVSCFCFLAEGTRRSKCECPVDIRSIPARRNRHHNVTSPFRISCTGQRNINAFLMTKSGELCYNIVK